jgi:hypothetical protein
MMTCFQTLLSNSSCAATPRRIAASRRSKAAADGDDDITGELDALCVIKAAVVPVLVNGFKAGCHH